MALGKLVPDIVAALDGGHEIVDDGLALGSNDLRGFFTTTDVFAIGGVIGHQCTV